ASVGISENIYSIGNYTSVSPELIDDPSFDTGGDWTVGTGCSVSAGQAIINHATPGTITEAAPFTVVAGATYRIELVCNFAISGSVTVAIGGTDSDAIDTVGTYVFYLEAGDTTEFTIGSTGTAALIVFSDVSVKRVGNLTTGNITAGDLTVNNVSTQTLSVALNADIGDLYFVGSIPAIGIGSGASTPTNSLIINTGDVNIIGTSCNTEGVDATDVLTVVGGKGDSDSSAAGTKGADIFLISGAGGDSGDIRTGGAGGDISIIGGNAGYSMYAITADGGDINIVSGAGGDIIEEGIAGDGGDIFLTISPPGDTGVEGDPGIYGNIYLAKDGGNVGIGTTTPKNTLNVIGDINATGSIYTDGNFIGNMILAASWANYPAGMTLPFEVADTW
ncbi:unnamed protein product, partial [marine sediment metagenome]